MVLSKRQAVSPVGDLWLPTALTSQAAPRDVCRSGKTSQPFLVPGSQVAAAWLLYSERAIPTIYVSSSITEIGSCPSLIPCLVELEGNFPSILVFWELTASCKLSLCREGQAGQAARRLGF